MKKTEKKIKTTEEQKEWFNAVGNRDVKTIQRMLEEGFDVNYQSSLKWTPLHFACYWGYLDIAKLLIDNGADITARDINGDTPLDNLKRVASERYEELMQWLSENHPEKMLEYMASESVQSKGTGL